MQHLRQFLPLGGSGCSCPYTKAFMIKCGFWQLESFVVQIPFNTFNVFFQPFSINYKAVNGPFKAASKMADLMFESEAIE